MSKSWKAEDVENLKRLADFFTATPSFGKEQNSAATHEWLTENNLSMGRVMNALRIAILGAAQGPDIFAICEFLGKEETLSRIARAIDTIPAN